MGTAGGRFLEDSLACLKKLAYFRMTHSLNHSFILHLVCHENDYRLAFNYLHHFDRCSSVFTSVHLCSAVSIFVFSCVHLCSPVFICAHLCSSVFTFVYLCSPVFICVHPCSPVFICFMCVHLCSPVWCSRLDLISLEPKRYFVPNADNICYCFVHLTFFS